jgi:hypothetical protein
MPGDCSQMLDHMCKARARDSISSSSTTSGEFSCELGLQSIILEMNSLQVVNVVKANGPNWCRYGQLVADVQVVLSSQGFWQIRHIRRAANYVAHGLAKA